MGENVNNSKIAENVSMPTMSMEDIIMAEEVESDDTVLKQAQQTQISHSNKVDLNKSIFGTSSYQMVVGKRNASLQRLEEYRITKPAIAAEIDKFVACFDYKNPLHIELFAKDVMGQNSVKSLTEYLKSNKDNEAYEDIRVMLLDFIDDIQPRPVKKSLMQKFRDFIESKGEKAELSKLETARIEEVIDVMTKRTQSSLIEVSTKTRTEIAKFLSAEQKKSLQIDMYVIAGELILKKIEEEYLPVLKAEYEKDPTSVEKKLALKEGEERTIDFLSRLNNVITTSAITLINVDTLLKEKEINKKVEIFLKDILENTIPILTQQSAIRVIDRKNQIPIEEATKIQQITEQVFVQNAKQVGEMYVSTIEHAGKPFISVEAIEEATNYCKEAVQRADEIKAEKLKFQFETHERLENLNNQLKISASELAFKTMTKEELEELQNVADSFKPIVK